jgi:hypothetical protein
VEKLLPVMETQHAFLPRLVLCVGDDWSNEGLHTFIRQEASQPPMLCSGPITP